MSYPKYENITPKQFINILKTENVDKLFVDTLTRRFNKHNMNIATAINVVNKAKGIDLTNKIKEINKEYVLSDPIMIGYSEEQKQEMLNQFLTKERIETFRKELITAFL